jgi:hypothetical protein
VDHVLQVSENEKRVLRSILEKRRAGTLSILDLESHKELVTIDIPREISNKDIEINIFARQLIRRLSKFKDKRIEIVFEPLE